MELRIDSRSITDYKSLMKTIKNAINANWADVTFTSISPDVTSLDSVNTPIISYRLKEKAPGEMKNATEIKPRIRETIKIDEEMITNTDPSIGDILIKGGSIEVWGQIFDYVIEFSVHGSNSDEADEAADRFQQFIFKYTGYLKKRGVSEILFINMVSDNPVAKAKLETRKIYYLFRIDEIVGVKVPVIENILIDTHVHESEFTRIVDVYVRDSLNETTIDNT